MSNSGVRRLTTSYILGLLLCAAIVVSTEHYVKLKRIQMMLCKAPMVSGIHPKIFHEQILYVYVDLDE